MPVDEMDQFSLTARLSALILDAMGTGEWPRVKGARKSLIEAKSPALFLRSCVSRG